MQQANGVVGSIRQWAIEDGDRAALTWLPHLDAAGVTTTFAQLDTQAGEVAAAVRAHTRGGDRVLLIQPPGPRFVAAFVGCLYAGRVPVPVYPALDSPEGRSLIARVREDCEPALAWVTDAEVAEGTARLLRVPSEWRTTPGLVHLPDRAPDPTAVAFLQYTSGSTSSPKGVVVTHGNLAANVAAIAETFQHDRDEVILSWLPAYHDMGLIGNILHPLTLGSGTILCPPTAFIRRPLSWLTSIHRLGVTTSGAPNFAYELVVAALEREGVPEVDLRRWRVAYSGAEPVVAESMRRFAELLAPHGFDPGAIMPCYGLAEATLLVASADRGDGVRSREAADGGSAVACGWPRGCEVVVTDAADRPLAEGQVGEIRVSGPSVAAGYWGRPDDDTFAGPVLGRDGTWLRTGDLGFLADGELHVAGRSKDVIIVRGRNHHPHDIERLAGGLVPAFRPGHVVAFASPDGEGVVVVGEVRPGAGLTEADSARLARSVANAFGLAVRDVVAAPRRGIPRTTSGKLRRAETRRRYEAGEYPTAASPATDPEAVAHLVAEALGHRPAPDEALVEAGLDSLRAVWLSGALSSRAGIEVPVRDLLAGATLAELTSWTPTAATPPATGADPYRLAAAQQALVFLDQLAPDSDEYTISFACELDPAGDVAAFERALRSALLAQPQWGRRIVRNGPAISAEPVPERDFHDVLALVPVPVRAERLAEHLADAAALPFRLAAGPLVRVYHWRVGARSVYQLVAHHIATDLWSLGLLFEDVAARYETLRHGLADRPTPVVDRYPAYVAEQEAYLTSDAAAARDSYLRDLIPSGHPPLAVRTDRPRGPKRDARAGQMRLSLPEDVSARLGSRDAVALLTALWGVCLHRYGGPSPVVVGTPVTGRTTGAHAAVAGLCTNTVPLAIPTDPELSLDALVRQVRAQLLAGVSAGLYPLSRAVEVLRPARDPGRNPLVETLVTVQESPIPRLPHLMGALADADWIELGTLRLRPVPVPRGTCRYDLDLVVTPRESGGHLLTLDYAAHLFDGDTAERVLRTYAAMVVAATAPSAVTLADAMVLSAEDRARYETAGHGPGPVPQGSLVELVRRHAAARPDAPAVVDDGTAIGFGQFAARVDRLAGVLAAVAAQDERTGR
ncbi:Acyl-CoA synthetase (AMP-forming)/AMP-acid ligase II [Micromonospora pallida]|uniref:Acyl-CoA synthetase (AMP-forming)/AMP-acid ligase II n=1 Tax=Micromonospora pallida TaxID=145854 RepID=A0A1C6SDC7_9ACTN|nr:fatty acyl-AMP ligase [Micromonospora pallida]SCL27496.1 Acyl-CoA synthetase (AMP-forming)/AMP-acid ligase II [Micromonospora pallida]